MRNDPELWNGVHFRRVRQDLFLKAFEDAGFKGVTLLKRDDEPWQTVQGVEFRSVTVEARSSSISRLPVCAAPASLADS